MNEAEVLQAQKCAQCAPNLPVSTALRAPAIESIPGHPSWLIDVFEDHRNQAVVISTGVELTQAHVETEEPGQLQEHHLRA